MTIRVAIRGFVGRVRQFDYMIELDDADVEHLAPAVAAANAAALASHALHMIEIEFLDEPDINRRFFRFGTDPTGMIAPISIDLSKRGQQ